MKFSLALLTLILTNAALVSAHATPCTTDQLSVAVDGEGGAFNGMSHSGTLLVLRNLGPGACTVAGFPELLFTDSTNATLPIARAVPRGMHPGPVVLPVTIMPEAELTSRVTWVSGEVYDHSQCLTPAALSVVIGGQRLSTPLTAHICGPRNKVTYNMTKLVPDPTEPPHRSGSR
jgi:hypothetical protein